MQLLKFVQKKVWPPYVTGTVATPVGPVPVITTVWSRQDRWGMIKSRSSAFRMAYTVEPGLYAVGTPDKNSEVLVTANYKLTFDILRRNLAGIPAWVLVLDTKSINVWCAAGKGTFGTEELIKRMAVVQLDRVVDHRRVILPQLGAVGVASGEVQKRTGFRVHFGPCEARDIPAYLKAGRKKTREMSVMRFGLVDRIVLTPMEINPAMKQYRWFAAAVLIIFGLQPSGILFSSAWSGGLPFLLLGLVAVLAGAFLTPALLPYVPFRSFAVKGWIMGMAAVLPVFALIGPGMVPGSLLMAAVLILFPALSSYIALQFTGSTTFTGMSGVKKELKIGIPLYFTAIGVSLVLVVLYKLKEWEVL
jgi:acetyl-CoA decarbonylase/synthase complex subunit gamma